MFHPLVETWFARRFGAPTPAQAQAWPLIADGTRRAGHRADRLGQDARGVPVRASTGSSPRRSQTGGELPDADVRSSTSRRSRRCRTTSGATSRSRSPSCARSRPSSGCRRRAIRTAVRTGDTTARERREAVKRPPHILVTTPESLYILLTSESGRRALRDVRTVIVDEIHAVAADKRGAHLALSLERLDALVTRGRRARCSASACRRRCGRSTVAGGCCAGRRGPRPPSSTSASGATSIWGSRCCDDELGAVCTNEQWGEIYDRVADLARAHRSTLVFVNTRRLVERVAHAPGRAARRGARSPRTTAACRASGGSRPSSA